MLSGFAQRLEPGYAVKLDRRRVEKTNPEDQQPMEAYQKTISILKNLNRSLHEQPRFMMGEIRGYKEIARKMIPHHLAGSYQNPIEMECGNSLHGVCIKESMYC